jgi:hypothetical protein
MAVESNFTEKSNLGFFRETHGRRVKFNEKNGISVFFALNHGRRVSFHEKT